MLTFPLGWRVPRRTVEVAAHGVKIRELQRRVMNSVCHALVPVEGSAERHAKISSRSAVDLADEFRTLRRLLDGRTGVDAWVVNANCNAPL